MKTTLDLPDELMKSVKLRAVEENRTLTDLIAELLRRGMEESEPKAIRNRVKLPLVYGAHGPQPPDAFSPERIAEILLEQEVEAHNDLVR